MALIFSSYFQDSSIISPFPEHSHLTLSIGKASDMRAIKSLPILPLLFPLLSEFRIYPFPNPQYDSNELYPFIIFKSFFVYSTKSFSLSIALSSCGFVLSISDTQSNIYLLYLLSDSMGTFIFSSSLSCSISESCFLIISFSTFIVS